jgi:hypothetical protein
VNLRPEALVDHGCWISDDRTYAFISSDINGVGEIGYHGVQPVSRNSRVFAGREGVISFRLRDREGSEHLLHFEDVDWTPGFVRVRCASPMGRCDLSITTAGRRLIVTATPIGTHAVSFVVLFHADSMHSDVHGHRAWASGSSSSSHAVLRFRDTIILGEWIMRTGPYAGDFLIPEPLRRKIFKRACRSGFATADDLLPAYSNSPVPVYDAVVTVVLGGRDYVKEERGRDLAFRAPDTDGLDATAPFVVEFKDGLAGAASDDDPVLAAAEIRERHTGISLSAPVLQIPDSPLIGRFFETVPGLVESCVIRDHGIPRATPGRYYWIWAWDAMVTASASLRWGNVPGAESTLLFVHSHRDEGGLIPMQWTRSLDPLDTQPRGSLEVLLTSLAHTTFLETRDRRILEEVYPSMTRHLAQLRKESDTDGLFRNMGFYPDLPLPFGRTEASAVALEIGNFYTFCRTCEDVAVAMGDEITSRQALQMAERLEASFLARFWDNESGFLVDAVDVTSGDRNISYPLFTLMFLHSALGWPLIRPKLAACAGFIAQNHLSSLGTRLLPSWDRNAGSETATGSWYPHWDLYALKVLRRAARVPEIMTWLRSVQRVLDRLGYAPEFLALDRLSRTDTDSWLRHGAPSNLNCVTGWYQALLEGIVGLEFDPGGITLIPLALPLGEVVLSGIHHCGTVWNVTVHNGESGHCSLRIDGEELHGCMKVPSRFSSGGEHTLEVVYDAASRPRRFMEFVNAELLETAEEGESVLARIRALGCVDVVYTAPAPGRCFLDGKEVTGVAHLSGNTYTARLRIRGDHTLRI